MSKFSKRYLHYVLSHPACGGRLGWPDIVYLDYFISSPRCNCGALSSLAALFYLARFASTLELLYF
jgi:hypothetical protein